MGFQRLKHVVFPFCLLVPGCSPEGSRTGADEPSAAETILDAAQRAAGAWPTPTSLQLLADADVQGPSGDFRTLMHSSADGRVRMEQPHSGFLAGVGRTGGWRVDPASGQVEDLGAARAFVRGHELHLLALLPRARLTHPRFLGQRELDSGPALAVALTSSTGDSLVAYFDPLDTLPMGLLITGPEPPVSVRWSDWAEDGGVRLFRRATISQGPEVFTYAYRTLELVSLPDSLFEPPGDPASTDADVAELRRLHRELLRAHVEGDVDLWMTLEAERFVDVGRGRVTYPPADSRRAQREAYLGDATFSAYRDVHEPIVRVSDDGSLGWLIAEVEVQGTRTGDDGARRAFHDVWAWVELYERVDGRWRMVGNASNRREADAGS